MDEYGAKPYVIDKNITHGSGSRYVNIIAGSLYENGQTVSGIQGDSAKIVISGNSVFENIYAGGLNGGYDGSVMIEITKGSGMQIGSIYGSGADETPLKEGDWFNVKEEPAPPSANSGYTVSGQVSVQFNRLPATAVDGTGAQGGMSVSAATEYPNITLKLRNISRLAVTEGTLQSAEITDSDMADVEIHSGATLDLSKANFGAVNNFYGGGTVVIGDTDTLVLSGEVLPDGRILKRRVALTEFQERYSLIIAIYKRQIPIMIRLLLFRMRDKAT